jgi:CheY-like chemotaxis protein
VQDTSKALRVLIVEDETINRSLIRATLARSTNARIRDCIVLEAGSLAEARILLASQAIDVVLLDVHLPDGSGLRLAEELRDIGQARPRIVVVSASVLPDERAAAHASGIDAFLTKPFALADLITAISPDVPMDKGS